MINQTLKKQNKIFITNGSRHRKLAPNSEVTYSGESFSKLTKHIKRSYGINNIGRRTCRGKVKGCYKKYRTIDWKRNKHNIEGTVVRIERDPNRSANIALIKYIDGEYRYILAPKDLVIGEKISSSTKNDVMVEVGNAMKLGKIAPGLSVHSIEINPNEGGKIVRAAGTQAIVLSHENNRTKVKLPSGEIRTFSSVCTATLGSVGNLTHNKTIIGSAGKKVLRGRKPIVRGTAKNPRDHPHGGGEGKQPLGRNPVNKNGKPMFGKTRRRSFTNKFIHSRSRNY